jgi:polyhydroxyalkanoate synthesis regulator phasin
MKVEPVPPQPVLPDVSIRLNFREAQMLRALLYNVNDEYVGIGTANTSSVRRFVDDLKHGISQITGTLPNDAMLEIKSAMVLKRIT